MIVTRNNGINKEEMETLLDHNPRLKTLWKRKRKPKAVHDRIKFTLNLQRLQLRTVLLFLVQEKNLPVKTRKAYKERLVLLEKALGPSTTSCCAHTGIKTCDLASQAAFDYVMHGRKGFMAAYNDGMKKIDASLKKCTEVSIPLSSKDPLTTLRKLAVKECLGIQKSELNAQKAAICMTLRQKK